MSFRNVFVLFLGLLALVFTPIMVGHGLSEGSLGRIGIGLLSLTVGAVIVSVHVRLVSRSEDDGGASSGH